MQHGPCTSIHYVNNRSLLKVFVYQYRPMESIVASALRTARKVCNYDNFKIHQHDILKNHEHCFLIDEFLWCNSKLTTGRN